MYLFKDFNTVNMSHQNFDQNSRFDRYKRNRHVNNNNKKEKINVKKPS